MADNFYDRAFSELIGHEGGYTADRKDKGNWTGGGVGSGKLNGTKYGISAGSYPHLDIKGLTLAQAKDIYFEDYWKKIRGPQIEEFANQSGDPDGWYDVLFDLFDTAVNSGPKTAIKLLQKAVGTTPDGDFGPKTWEAMVALDPTTISARFNGHRLAYMADLGVWDTYSRGWARRIAANLIDTQ